jgi:hypothetical protein
MKTRTFVVLVLVFMVFLSVMPSDTSAKISFDGMAPSSARDIPVLRYNVIDIFIIVFDIINPALGPILG